MAPPPAEFTVICIDNAGRAFWHRRIYNAQIEAIKYYCETIFKCNPDNIVSILTMSSLQYGVLVSPTSDLQQILRRLQDVRLRGEGQAEFQCALGYVYSTFFASPPTMKRRLLMFVGGTIDLERRIARLCGTKLKESGVALNVFNFYSLKIDYERFGNARILRGEYHYARRELDILVTTVNDKGNSHIVDIGDESSSILDTLSKSILKKHLHYLEKKAAADNKYVEAPQIQFVKPELERFHNEKNKSAADDEYGQALVIEFGNLSTKTPHISGKKNQKKAEENVFVKQELELSRNENDILSVKPKLERFHNEKNKSAGDDKCVQAPGIKKLSNSRKKRNKRKC